MTRVCLLGEPGLNLQYELLSRETSRDALSAYDLERPFENAIAIRTISVGAAVSLLNDLQWYLTRFVADPIVQEPSVDDTDWVSRSLAIELRNGDVEPEETGEFCKIYGVEPIDGAESADEGDEADPSHSVRPSDRSPPDTDGDRTGGADDGTDAGDDDTESAAGHRVGDEGTDAPDIDPDPFAEPTHRLVEPLYARRVDGEVPAYDLREVDDTLVVRLTREEFVE